ncbi:MAG TPA: hypothetical protein VKM56_01740 [Verrucomicrobiae bacterium]|nr:hypothetical protein [Verrucomicrobiae bacterium]
MKVSLVALDFQNAPKRSTMRMSKGQEVFKRIQIKQTDWIGWPGNNPRFNPGVRYPLSFLVIVVVGDDWL